MPPSTTLNLHAPPVDKYLRIMWINDGWQKKAQIKAPKKSKRNQLRSLTRVAAQIQLQESREVIDARLFLTDLQPNGGGFFTSAPIAKGQKVYVVISYPRHLFLSAEVIYCAMYAYQTRVLSTESFAYRVLLKFEFESQREKEHLQQYVTHARQK